MSMSEVAQNSVDCQVFNIAQQLNSLIKLQASIEAGHEYTPVGNARVNALDEMLGAIRATLVGNTEHGRCTAEYTVNLAEYSSRNGVENLVNAQSRKFRGGILCNISENNPYERACIWLREQLARVNITEGLDLPPYNAEVGHKAGDDITGGRHWGRSALGKCAVVVVFTITCTSYAGHGS